MTLDLEHAIKHLETTDHTCVLCRDSQLYTSSGRGVQPLLEFLDSGADFSDFSAADKVVGRATAFLYALLGVRQVYAQVLSDGAAEVLTQQGIRFFCAVRVTAIRNRSDTGPCPMERATQGIRDPHTALVTIRQTFQTLQK